MCTRAALLLMLLIFGLSLLLSGGAVALARPLSGGVLAFTSMGSLGRADIYLLDINTGARWRLTHSESYIEAPHWSPDGQRLAFTSDRDNAYNLYVMDIPRHIGRTPTRITRQTQGYDYSPMFSPDGSRLVFFRVTRTGSSGIYLVDSMGAGEPERLSGEYTFDQTPAWSPDGTQIVFSGARGGRNWELFVLDLTTDETRQLTYSAGEEYAPDWSPDGSQILFTSYRHGSAEIYVINADGTGERRLTENNENDTAPSWSPDGRRIAFASERDGNLELYVMNADGTGICRLTYTILPEYAPAWMP